MNKRQNRGITLIALVITIIILLILAGVTISLVLGNNGILGQAQSEGEKTKIATAEEELGIIVADYIVEKQLNGIEFEDYFTGKVDSIENDEDGTYTVEYKGYEFIIDDNNYTVVYKGPEKSVAPPTLGEIKESEITIGTTDPRTAFGVIEIAWLDMNNKVIRNPLAPTLMGMEKVGWTDANAEIPSNEITTNSAWYNYNNNKWANAKNSDGSYFVWIPRYAYKIIYFDTQANKDAYIADNTSTTGIRGYSTIYGIVNKADNKIIDKTQTGIIDKVKTTGYTDYIPHPAFLGTGTEDLGGGFGDSKGIAGIWVAKYEMSREDSSNSGVTWAQTATVTGNVSTVNTGTNQIRMVSKPRIKKLENYKHSKLL